LLRPQDHPTVASREADDGLSVVLVGLSVLLLSIGGFVGAFWVAVDLEIAPPNQVSFDRWWFFPVGMLAATLGVTIALYRRGCRRSVVVLGALSTAGLAVLLVFCPYL
jgi:peptidoglycan/LPS O-acetylase OafA/YrhL